MIRSVSTVVERFPWFSKSSGWLVLSLIVVGLIAIFCLGAYFGHNRILQDRNQISLLNDTNANLQAELTTAKEDNIFSQRQLQIQQEAYKQLNINYAGLDRKNSYLESRLDFYRSMISPVDGQPGPTIQSLKYRQEGDDVAFDLTLVQAIRHEQQVSGNLHIRLYQVERLVAEWPTTDSKVINFQYFEQVSGVFEGVELNGDTKIKVELVLSEQDSVVKWFPALPNEISN